MLARCHQLTAAAPLLGPSLRRIRATPLARLAIGYRLLMPAGIQCLAKCPPPAVAPVAPANPVPNAGGCCQRALGAGLLLDRLLTGGNQNEGIPLANWQIAGERQQNCCGGQLNMIA